MSYLKFLPLLLIFLSSTGYAICVDILREYALQDYFSKQPALRNAANEVLKSYKKQGKTVVLAEFASSMEEFKKHDINFNNYRDLIKARQIKEYENKMQVKDFGSTGVERMTIKNRVYYFRSVKYSNTKPRREYAAYLLSILVNVKVVPKTEMVVVDGEFGSLSEGYDGFRFNHARFINQKLLNDAKAFEFLSGNIDATENNLIVTTLGETIVFDHDFAFIPGLGKIKSRDANDVMTYPKEALLGVELPSDYNQYFIEALKKLSDSVIDKKFEYILSEAERSGIKFRRDILLQHINTL